MARNARKRRAGPAQFRLSVAREFLQFRTPKGALRSYAKRSISPGYEFSLKGWQVPGNNVRERRALIAEVIRGLGSDAPPDFEGAERVLVAWASKHIGKSQDWRKWELDERPLVAVAAEGMVYVRRLLHLYRNPAEVLRRDMKDFKSQAEGLRPPNLMEALEYYGLLALAWKPFRLEFERLSPAEMNGAIDKVHGRTDSGRIGRPRKDSEMAEILRAYDDAPRGTKRRVLKRWAARTDRAPESLLRSIRAFRVARRMNS